MGEKFFHNSKFCCLHPSSAWLRYRSGLVLWISNIANFFDLSNFVHVIVIYFIGQSGSSDKKNLILVKSWKRIVGSVTRKLSPNPTFIAKNPILQKSHLTFFFKNLTFRDKFLFLATMLLVVICYCFLSWCHVDGLNFKTIECIISPLANIWTIFSFKYIF